MEALKKAILDEGRVIGTHILKVDSFLNHCIDPHLMQKIGNRFAELFAGEGITKIVTIESSGIAPAVFTGLALGVPVIFAKKTESNNLDPDTYRASVHSFTRGVEYVIRINRRFITEDDTILFLDDFLAKGQALLGLIQIANDAGARIAGAGIVIEKGFQDGGRLVRETGIRVESLAIVEKMDPDSITFRE